MGQLQDAKGKIVVELQRNLKAADSALVDALIREEKYSIRCRWQENEILRLEREIRNLESEKALLRERMIQPMAESVMRLRSQLNNLGVSA